MDPVILKLAQKKGPVFQCTHTDCSEHGDRLAMVRHVLLRHTAQVKVPFKCSACDFVSMTEKELEKHTKWYLPHKNQGIGSFKVIKGEEPLSTSELKLQKWEKATSVMFWYNKLQEKKTTDNKADRKLSSIENSKTEQVVVEERVEDIRGQLLGLDDEDYGIDIETDKENDKSREDNTYVAKKEKILDEKLKKIDEVFRMVSEIYRNGPTRGLSPIPLRAQTPPLRKRSTSRSPVRRKTAPLAPHTSSSSRHHPRSKRANNWREMRWRRATTLFEDKDHHQRNLSPKVKSVVKIVHK